MRIGLALAGCFFCLGGLVLLIDAVEMAQDPHVWTPDYSTGALVFLSIVIVLGFALALFGTTLPGNPRHKWFDMVVMIAGIIFLFASASTPVYY